MILSLLMLSFNTLADTYVQGYTRNNGTYVEPHYRSSPNSTINDNYSTRGNTNPYTGNNGYLAPSYDAPQYQQPTQQDLEDRTRSSYQYR